MTEGNDGFFDESEDIVQNGRYRIIDPTTEKSTLVSRASNTGKSLDNSFALGRSRLRKTLKGLTKRPDILRRLLTTKDPEAIPVKDLDDMLTSALAAIGDSLEGSNSGANDGTAAHNVLQRIDEGVSLDDIPEEYHPLCRAYIFELQQNGLTPVATELTLYNSRFKRVGRCDNVYRDRSGKLVIGDKKTTRWIEYAKNSIAAQTGIYNSSDFVSTVKNPAADAEFVPIGDDNRFIQEYAILVLIDLDNETVALYRVDTEHGRRGAVIEAQAKAWANTDGVILPYVPPADSATFGAEQMVAVPQHPSTSGAVAFEPITVTEIDPGGNVVKAQSLQAQITFPGAGAVAGNGAAVGPLGVETNLPQIRQATAGPPLTTPPLQSVISPAAVQPGQLSVDQLAQLPKPELQTMLKALGGADLNHHRKWLAEKIVELRSGGGTVSVATGSGGIGGDPFGNPATPVTDPQAEAKRQVITAIEIAPSVTDIRKIYDMVIGAGAIWLDEYTAASRTRAEQLDNAAAMSVSNTDVIDNSPPNQELDVMARINDVTNQTDLAEIWNDVTEEGTELDNWTLEIQKFADKKLAELAQPKPSSNPFG